MGFGYHEAPDAYLFGLELTYLTPVNAWLQRAAALVLIGALFLPGGVARAKPGPESFADLAAKLLPAVVNIGLGSPTGVKFGTRSHFHEPYRRALYAFDWSYGRIFAVHLKPQGASYTADYEVFLQGKPLNVTSLQFGKDGAMYFITGGRGTQSGLYRVSYVGNEPTGPLAIPAPGAGNVPSRDARELRHQLESFH